MAGQFSKMISALLVAVFLLGAGPALAAKFHYTKLDVPGEHLTNLGAGDSLNDSDQVVGTTESTAGVYQGFLWQHGTFTVFQQCNILNSINASGLAVGDDTASFAQYCTIITKSGATQLYPVGRRGTITLAGVNAAGTVIAQEALADSKTRGLIFQKRRGTVFAIQPEIKYGGTFPTGINDGGTIVGSYTPPMASWNQGFTYTGGTYSMFNVPAAAGTYPLFITAGGVIGGEYLASKASVAGTGFLFDGSSYTTIDPPGATRSFVVGIGPGGEIVGSWSESSGASHGFIYSGKLYHTIDFPGATATTMLGVNALGSLVGDYRDSNGNSHPFIAQCAAAEACTE